MDMSNLLKQAQKMQEEMVKAQEGLSDVIVEATSGGGMVKVKANAKLEILSVSIEKEVVDPEDKEMLEDLVAAAVNQALQMAQQLAQEMGHQQRDIGTPVPQRWRFNIKYLQSVK